MLSILYLSGWDVLNRPQSITNSDAEHWRYCLRVCSSISQSDVNQECILEPRYRSCARNFFRPLFVTHTHNRDSPIVALLFSKSNCHSATSLSARRKVTTRLAVRHTWNLLTFTSHTAIPPAPATGEQRTSPNLS